jgi:hypothetical protein
LSPASLLTVIVVSIALVFGILGACGNNLSVS